MVPAVNTTMEGGLAGRLPAGRQVTRIGIPRGQALLTPATMPAHRALAGDLAARHVAPATQDPIAHGCTLDRLHRQPHGRCRARRIDRARDRAAGALLRAGDRLALMREKRPA
jgi:hypothetical protein